ncbi:UNVERIFIED_ORG: hypothetical protein J2W74_001996 [Methylorubrum zatmanii]
MDDHADFFDFVALVLTEGDDAAVRAFDRALDQIRAPDSESTNASPQYNRGLEADSVV